MLEDDVWIAATVTVTADTRIARGCVIGANAVVTKDTRSMGLYTGVPATPPPQPLKRIVRYWLW